MIERVRDRLAEASEPALRELARRCADAAVAAAGLDEPATADLDALCERLEAEALAAEDAHARGETGEAAMLEAFDRARAATAVRLARQDDAYAAASQALEEAAVVFADREDELARAIAPALDRGGDRYVPAVPVRLRRTAWFDDLLPVVKRLPEEAQRAIGAVAVELVAARHPPRSRRLRRALRALDEADFGDTRTRRRLLGLLPDRVNAEDETTHPDATPAWAAHQALGADAPSAAVSALLAAFNALGHDDPALPEELAARGIIRF
ncbi:MAG TPA: hypothetical protein VM266_07250 [Solirubrobacteraceae bacterium]|nr:hypothetical protein [Solirubrobacteraceae bacterium]